MCGGFCFFGFAREITHSLKPREERQGDMGRPLKVDEKSLPSRKGKKELEKSSGEVNFRMRENTPGTAHRIREKGRNGYRRTGSNETPCEGSVVSNPAERRPEKEKGTWALGMERHFRGGW